MREFKKRQNFKKKIYSKPIIFLLFIILLAILHGAWGIYQKSKISKQKLEVSQENYDALKDRHTAIETQIQYLHTDSGNEEGVRTKFNLAKEGEHVIILVDDKNKSSEEETEHKEQGFWSKVFFWSN